MAANPERTLTSATETAADANHAARVVTASKFAEAATTGAAMRATELPAEYCRPRWYATYTSANREKRVAQQLGLRKMEHFLPVYASVRTWKDRRVKLDLPLFPGYVFVRMTLQDRLQVVQIPGVARLVGFNGFPMALPEEEIQALRNGLNAGIYAEPHPYLKVGRRARIYRGPLAGMEGILVRRKHGLRVVLSIHTIQKSVLVDVDEGDISPL